MRTRRVLSLAAGLVLAASVAGAAPKAAPRKAAPATPPAPDVFLGYSYTKAGDASLNGIGLQGTFPVGDTFRIVLDLSGHDGTFAGADFDQIGLMAGGRWSPLRSRVRPFAEGLVGLVRTSQSVEAGDVSVSDSDSDFGVALGGGLDFGLSERWSLRGLFHLRLVSGEGNWDADPRFAAGFVYRLGR
jgi:Outer membrane protein beta-barrel domain